MKVELLFYWKFPVSTGVVDLYNGMIFTYIINSLHPPHTKRAIALKTLIETDTGFTLIKRSILVYWRNLHLNLAAK